jgi:hypothetical protein
MCDLINHQWLVQHIAEYGDDLDHWSWHARNKAVSEALHNCENNARLNDALSDFFANHGLKYLYMEDSVLPLFKTREIVWNYLSPYIFEQIENMERDK